VGNRLDLNVIGSPALDINIILIPHVWAVQKADNVRVYRHLPSPMPTFSIGKATNALPPPDSTTTATNLGLTAQ